MSIETGIIYDEARNTYNLFIDYEWICEGTYEECEKMYSNHFNCEAEYFEEINNEFEEYEEYLRTEINYYYENDELFLYHATDKKNLESIMKNGLSTTPEHHNYNDMSCDDLIFLALNPKSALNFVKNCDNPPEDIVLLQIPLKSLVSEHIKYDWNNLCEYRSEISSIAYNKNISPADITEISLKDINSVNLLHFEDFKGTYLYDIIDNTFYYEVESNKEDWDFGFNNSKVK